MSETIDCLDYACERVRASGPLTSGTRLVMQGIRSTLVAWDGEAGARMDAEQRELEEAEIATGLVRRIKQGDAAAENALVRRYGDRLRYVLSRQMAQYPHDVDDVVQEALTAALLRLRDQSIEDPARLGGFIYGIAKNLRLARLRDHARHDGHANPDILPSIPDDQVRPDQLIAGSETTRIVRQLLAELGSSKGRERDREVLVRLYIRQENREEICAALDIEADHLRRVLHRAKQRLKSLLTDSMSPDALGMVSDD